MLRLIPLYPTVPNYISHSGWLMLDICFFNGRNIWKNQLFFLVHTSCNRNYGGMIWIWKQWRWGCKNHGSRWLTNEIRLIWSHLFFPVFWALKPIRTIARSSNYLPLLSITLIGEPCLLMLVAFIILNPEFCCWKIPTFPAGSKTRSYKLVSPLTSINRI